LNETLFLFIIAVIALVAGGFLGHFIAQLKSKNDTGKLEERLQQASSQIEKLETQVHIISQEKETVRKEKETVNIELSMAASTVTHLEKKLLEERGELEKIQEKFSKEFENLANKILDSKSEKFTKQNKENIDTILKPLQAKIEKFEQKVDNTNKESIDRHAMLRQQIIGLKELNEQMSLEANNLTKALKGDSKIQGNWGELVLERVLEKSGLEKDREYFVQTSFTTEDGKRVLPDVVIHLPDNNKMIIDSKVSLVAYERFVNEDDPILKKQHLTEHVNSLKKHIEQLSSKNYHDLYTIESPDFVLLFVPIEPAFAIAINTDENIYAWAFEKNIVIVTPSTLLATLRTIDTMWNNQKQQQNAIEIATQAGRLYDQFVNLTDDLIKIGNQLNTVKGSYDGTMKKLTGQGNLIKKVESIKKLGIKQRKHINEKLVQKAEDELE
jgi:DNA recombination protein RmuC